MKPRTEHILYQSLMLLISAVLSFGISRVFQGASGIDASFLNILIPVIFVHLLVRLFFDPPLRALITFSSVILIALILFLVYPQLLLPIRNALIDLTAKIIYTVQYYSGQTNLVNRLMPFAVTASVAAFSLLVYATTIRIQIPLVWVIVLLTIMTLNAFRSVKQDPVGILSASFAILMLMVKRQPYRRESLSRPKKRQPISAMMVASPLILIAMIGSLLLSPLLPIRLGRQQQYLEGIADDISQALGIQPTSTLQSDFSISFAGFYPLGTRLGGPVTLTQTPVMDVVGHGESMLLRGAVYENYEGRSWKRQQQSTTYRLDNVFQTELKETVFDLDQPDPNIVSGGVVNGLIMENRLTITPLSSITSVIFTPGRPLSITPKTGDRFQVYFDDHGMLYSKYALTERNIYDVKSRVLLTSQRDFTSYINLAANLASSGRIPREALYSESYLQVPSTAYYRQNSSIRTLVNQLTESLTDPYAKALAIRRYLIEMATYNLNVAIPPANQDFVAWFLETRKGYCVYFATAEVIMCRLAGIPARYTEGFILDGPAQLNAKTIVTADRAHAWCEIYVPLVGWVPVDATPGFTVPSDETVNPEPTPDVTGTIETTEETTEMPFNPIDTTDQNNDAAMLALLGELLSGLLVCLVLSVIWLAIRNRIRILRYPELLRKLYPDPILRADIYWQELQILFSQDHLVLRIGETPIMFLERVRARWPGRAERLSETGYLISAIRYGRHIPKETELAMLGNLLSQIEESSFETRPVKHFFQQRLRPRLHGIDKRKRLIRDHVWRAITARLRFVLGTHFVVS